MTILTHNKVKEIIQEISQLVTSEELQSKGIDISLADIDDQSRVFLTRALALRQEEISTLVSPLAAASELREGECDV